MSIESESPQPRLFHGSPFSSLSVSVAVEYFIDPRGTARVKDTKTLKNDSDAPVHLSGEFKQAVNHNVTAMRVTDTLSPDKQFHVRILRGDDHHQVAVAIEVPSGHPFTIGARTQRTLVFEYEMSDATTILKGGFGETFLIKNRFGSVTYPYPFGNIEYSIKYNISKQFDVKRFKQLFMRPVLLMNPADMTLSEDETSFHVVYKFSCEARSVKYVHLALAMQPRSVVQWAAAFLSGGASSALVALAPRLLRWLAGVLEP